jgi:DNA polymerase-4
MEETVLRKIIHVDMDAFYASVEQMDFPELRGKPLAVGGNETRGVVSAASYEARKFGIHSAMPMRMAKQLCPEAIVLRGNSGIYTNFSKNVTDVIKESVPLYEKTSIDEFYIDLTGMDKFFGCHKLASELRQRITKETGLPISFGLSINKTVSKIATGEAKPDNEIRVISGNEKPFLAPLSVKKIPLVGNVTYKSLCDLGVKRIKTLQEMPVELMYKVLGKNGLSIWKKANGIDNSPVVQYHERKSISTERTFNKDTTDINKLKSIVIAMSENLAYQLRRGNKLTACVVFKIRYSDFQTYTKQQAIPYSAMDHTLIPVVLNLFKTLYSRRLLVRLIGVKFSHLVEGGHQVNLFEDDEKHLNLSTAIDNMRERYGDRAVISAAGMEARTISRWNPFNGEPPPLLANRKQ